MTSKEVELNFCVRNGMSVHFYDIESDIYRLKNDFTKDDIPEILHYKKKYIEFRESMSSTYYQDYYFSALHEVTKELFDFFKSTYENEFTNFEPKVVYADSLEDAVRIALKSKEFITVHTGKNPQQTIEAPKLLESTAPKFFAYLLHDKKELLAEKLKEQFGNEKGKTLALMLKVLEENEPRLIHIGNTQKGFFDSLKAYFQGDNGSQNAMFSSFTYNPSRDYEDYLSVKAKIDFILKQLDET
jgi:hypothetical protein